MPPILLLKPKNISFIIEGFCFDASEHKPKIQEIIKTMTGKLAHTLQGKTFDTPPIWLMRQAGRYLPEYLATRSTAGNFLNLCYTRPLPAKSISQPIRRFNFDAAILFSDILVIPHAMGQHRICSKPWPNSW